MLYYPTMSREPKQRSGGAVRAGTQAERETQQIPLVDSPGRPPMDKGSQTRPWVDQQTTDVPQETVPMPIPAWPSTPAVDEAPDKPPSLRRRDEVHGRSSVDSPLRQPWLVQRTG